MTIQNSRSDFLMKFRKFFQTTFVEIFGTEKLKNNEKLNDWFIEMDKLENLSYYPEKYHDILIRQINRLKLTGKI